MNPVRCGFRWELEDANEEDRSNNNAHHCVQPEYHTTDHICACGEHLARTKEELFQAMPHVMVGNGDGTRMEWRCTNGVWRWKHINDDGLVLAEGEGAP